MADAAATVGSDAGSDMHALATRLYPLCRSITGDGVRQTLAILAEKLPLQIHEISSGTPALDWTIPREWTIRDAWIKDPTGRKIVDFQQHNLHVLNYSSPVRGRYSLAELRPHLFTVPERPDAIPYRTSYYQENWGFCLPHRQLQDLSEGDYEVCVDSSLADGRLTYGELLLPGESTDEVLISTHCCHPSLANDNLSGIAVAARLAQELAASKRRYSYRFLFIPVTIGALAWLSRNETNVARIRHGLVLSCLGDSGGFTYKRSRRGDAPIDRIMQHVLARSGQQHELVDFSPYGYDERQFCSPGFNLPVGAFMRTPNGRFPEYHTSDDNLTFITPAALAGSLQILRQAVDVIERDRHYVNRLPKGEPQLGRRGLYASSPAENMARLWVLNLADGTHSLLQIAERSGLSFAELAAAAEVLAERELLTARS